MVKPEAVLPRFRKLDEYFSILEELRRYGREEFLSDPEHYGSAERFLQLSIEALNDIGNHIVAEEDWGSVQWYSDIPQRLHQQDVLDEELQECWIEMTGFRNVLVHDYVELDRQRVYEILQNRLEDLKAIREALVALL